MMTMLRKQWIFAAAVLGMAAGGARPAKAAVLYTSPADYTQTAYQSSSAAGVEQECSPFLISSSASVTQASWTGDYFDGTLVTDAFTLSLYSGLTVPNATALASTSATGVTRTDTGATNSRGLEVYLYTANLSTPFLTTGGTQYYIAILDSPSTWQWQLGTAGANYYRVGTDGTAWVTSGAALQDAFTLSGAVVPEPSPLVLSAVAALAAALIMRRSRSCGPDVALKPEAGFSRPAARVYSLKS